MKPNIGTYVNGIWDKNTNKYSPTHIGLSKQTLTQTSVPAPPHKVFLNITE